MGTFNWYGDNGEPPAEAYSRMTRDLAAVTRPFGLWTEREVPAHRLCFMAGAPERLWPVITDARPLEQDPDKVRLVVELPRQLDNFEFAAFTKWRENPEAKGPRFEIKKGQRKFIVVVDLSAVVDQVGQVRDVLDEFETAGQRLSDTYAGAKNQLRWNDFPTLRRMGFMKPE